MITADQHRAANRFGLGASRVDALAMGDDPVGWLTRQLDKNQNDAGPKVPDSVTTLAQYLRMTMDRRQAQDRAQGDEENIARIEQDQFTFRQQARQTIVDQMGARFAYAVATPTPYRERLVHFWSNHFTVSRQGKPQLIGSCVAYENETIRVGLDGFFADMLVRVVSHPVMLLYLDNAQSVGSKSRIGRRRKSGPNENLAREVLELHTLGVDGGYDQEDVKSLAKILTGWTVGNDRLRRVAVKPGAFAFVQMMHEPGTFRLLGKRYSENGVDQGVAALRNLGNHPATARHLATKLVRHFVADEPSAKAVDKIARVFIATQGHLPSVHKALIGLSDAWRNENKKLKTPHEYLVSVYRGLEIHPRRRIDAAAGSLRVMNHLPFNAPSPAGWPDLQSHWGSPNSLKQRIEWGIEVGRRVGSSTSIRNASDWLVDSTASRLLLASLERAESPAQALAMLIASPDLQWR